MVKIRLAKTQSSGKFSIIVIDARQKMTGKFIEKLGYYHPISRQYASEKSDKWFALDMVRAQYWIGLGAQPTDIIKRLMTTLQ